MSPAPKLTVHVWTLTSGGLESPDMENCRVAMRLVRGFEVHRWPMYAVFWVASGLFALAGICAALGAWVIFGR